MGGSKEYHLVCVCVTVAFLLLFPGVYDTSRYLLLIPPLELITKRYLWEIHTRRATQSQLCHLIDIFICLIGPSLLAGTKKISKKIYIYIFPSARRALQRPFSLFFPYFFLFPSPMASASPRYFPKCQGCHNTGAFSLTTPDDGFLLPRREEGGKVRRRLRD